MAKFAPWESEEDRKRKDDRRYTNRSSQFIRSLFQRVCGITPRNKKAINHRVADTCERNFEGLLELETDAYNAFFRGGLLESVVKEQDEYYSEYESNAKILDEVFKIKRVQKMLRKTVGNTSASVLATRQIRHMLDEVSQKIKGAINKAHKQAQEARKKGEKLQQMLDAYQAGQEAGVPQDKLDSYAKDGPENTRRRRKCRTSR